MTPRIHTSTQTRFVRCGTAATEFAIAFPLLMTLLLGCVDFGRVGYDSIALANAAGAGAHYAATHRVTSYTMPDWEQRIRDAVTEDFSTAPNFDPDALEILVNTTLEPDGGVLVTIEASHPFKSIVNWPGLPASIPLSETVEYRQYR